MRDEFRERAGDSSEWRLAKSIVMQMLDEGVDPSAAVAPGARRLDGGLQHRTARAARRDRRPPADRMTHGAGLAPGRRGRIPPIGSAPRTNNRRR